MSQKEIVGGIIEEFLSQKFNLLERELKVKSIKNKVISIIGPRRAGKTSFLLSLFSKFKKEKKSVIFFPLDDDRVYPPTIKTLQDVVFVAKELFPNKKITFFFDEIQEVENWELIVKRLVEREGHEVFVTGSSSKLLSKEIATQLRGRSISYLLLPFSFREIIKLNKIKIKRFYTENERANIFRLLEEYLYYGGFPEMWTKEKNFKIIKEYFDLIIFRDLVERYGIKNIKVLRLLIKTLILNYSSLTSINKIFNFFKSLNIEVSKTSLYNYVELLEDVFFVFKVKHFTNFKESESYLFKTYIVDNGFINLIVQDNKNKGKLMENIVFLELKRKENQNPFQEIYYYKTKNGKEIDFLVKDRNKIELIEVCYEFDEEHKKKLIKAMKELNLKESLCITWDEEDEIEEKGFKIKLVPLWKWLLDFR